MKKTLVINKIVLGAAVMALGLFSSCKDEEQAETTTPVENPAQPASNEAEGQQTAQLNPEHGLPGHRCEIPVGAPLSSSPNTTNATPAPTPSSSVSPIRIDQTPKVNPPHGEPGHDCAVPVGAELKQQ